MNGQNHYASDLPDPTLNPRPERWFFKLYRRHRLNPDAWEERIEGIITAPLPEALKMLAEDIEGFKTETWERRHDLESQETFYSLKDAEKHLLVGKFPTFGPNLEISRESQSNTARIPESPIDTSDTTEIDQLIDELDGLLTDEETDA